MEALHGAETHAMIGRYDSGEAALLRHLGASSRPAANRCFLWFCRIAEQDSVVPPSVCRMMPVSTYKESERST